MLTRTFRAMGTDVELLLDAAADERLDRSLDVATARIHEIEARFSRFREDSELSRLNRMGTARVSDDLLTLITLALTARSDTRGRFDPTVHNAMVAGGYDRSFDELPADRPEAATPTVACGGGVHVDGRRRTVTLAPGVGLDLGGIAKGYAAEAVAGDLAGAAPCLVNIGGDIATRGVPRDGVWPIGVETADAQIVIGVEANAGVATSGRDRRRWRVGGREHHHVIDPATGRPAASDVLRVTVVAASAVRAEILATALFLAGAEDAVGEADRVGATAIVVTHDGRTLLSGDLR